MQPRILLTERDHARLSQLITSSTADEFVLERLETELHRATLTSETNQLVQLGSRVTWETIETGHVRRARLIAPPERPGIDDVSVLTPAGCALIGLRSGDVFTWSDGPRRWRLRVVAVENDGVAP